MEAVHTHLPNIDVVHDVIRGVNNLFITKYGYEADHVISGVHVRMHGCTN